MKKALRSMVLAAGLVSATALASGIALADMGTPPDHGQMSGDHQKECGQGKHRHGKHFLQTLAKKLGLSEQQKTQAKGILKDSRAQAKPLRDELQNQRHQMHTLVMSGTADEAAIRAQAAKISSVEADLAVQRAKTAKQLRALLTPEQQTKLKELQAKWEEKSQKHQGHGRHMERHMDGQMDE